MAIASSGPARASDRLTGVEEVSMTLATPKVRVVHVTTRIGLIDAVHRIEPGLVERTVRRGARGDGPRGRARTGDLGVRHHPARRGERAVRPRRGGEAGR
ncbi:4-hydroxythreonine-4-phosphate dehydrogenase PdxA [Streptomyces roseirectus]|uniref:4-hydroxythreonine-4-phosphate dehydrogenase PdxA n=1 Tax=Streptomyces roseirectus TaxID=2768066 RepID=UPI00248461DA|nr:4-hydroxythreonine-4-phosphate dehydrogenase PdxA [Streptomyces roseirectus]